MPFIPLMHGAENRNGFTSLRTHLGYYFLASDWSGYYFLARVLHSCALLYWLMFLSSCSDGYFFMKQPCVGGGASISAASNQPVCHRCFGVFLVQENS
jgi:hypothetical protein